MGFHYKQALVVRQDLRMGRGKIAVQCSHASLSASEETRQRFPDWWAGWRHEGQCKVALKVKDLTSILKLEREAKKMRLPSYLVHDSGLTQVGPGTVTCLGIGPAPATILDSLTGKLALL